MIELDIVEEGNIGGWICDNPNCQYHFLTKTIPPHTIVAKISVTTALKFEIYCRDCIDFLYQQLKSKLDTKLWAFR